MFGVPRMTDLPADNLTMLTLVKESGELELSLKRLPMPQPRDHEVLVRVLATPINPSADRECPARWDAGDGRACRRGDADWQ